MRLIIGLFIGWILTGLIFQHSLNEVRSERDDAQQAAQAAADQLTDEQVNSATLLKAKAGASDTADKASADLASANLDKETLQSQLRTASQATADVTKERDSLTEQLAAAQAELREANKAALKAAHDSCPPPEVIPKETQKQEFAPAFKRADGTKTWRTDFDWDESKAKELGRLQFVCWGTRSCPHCDYFLEQCSNQKIAVDVFRNYVPCWITVQDRETHDLAERFGVNKFQYPGAMLRDPVSGKFSLWRPSKDNATLQSQVAEHAKALVQP